MWPNDDSPVLPALPPLPGGGAPWPSIEGITRRTPRAVRLLARMHTYARPSGSAAEAAFIARYIDSLPGVTADGAGNRLGIVPRPDGSPPRVLFSAHTDTVARAGGYAAVRLDPATLTLTLADPAAGCLGADDTAGCFILRAMYRARVPGLYIWHAGEERGCIGSSHVATVTPHLLDGIDLSVAFDRAGTSEIITHQAGERGASDTLAIALAVELARHDLDYFPSPHGVYTDNVHYFGHVAENVNLSVGYYSQHTIGERLDVRHVLRLARACIALDWHALPIERDPLAVPDDPEPVRWQPRWWDEE